MKQNSETAQIFPRIFLPDFFPQIFSLGFFYPDFSPDFFSDFLPDFSSDFSQIFPRIFLRIFPRIFSIPGFFHRFFTDIFVPRYLLGFFPDIPQSKIFKPEFFSEFYFKLRGRHVTQNRSPLPPQQELFVCFLVQRPGLSKHFSYGLIQNLSSPKSPRLSKRFPCGWQNT